MRITGYALTAVLIIATLTACGSGSNNSAALLLSSWPTSAQNVTTAYAQSVAFRNHTAMGWGNNGYGQLGNSNSGNSLTPVPVAGLPRTDGIVTGGTHTLAFRNLSGVWAWGNNGYGQLGNRSVTASHTPVQVFRNNSSASLSHVTEVAAGGYHSLAIANGVVWAWGANNWGQVGYDTQSLGYSTTARTVFINAVQGIALPASRISAGGGHSLALDNSLVNSGTVWAWGNNYAGQLGDNSTTNRTEPLQVVGVNGLGTLSNVTAIAAGGGHSLALLAGGTVVSWGYNYYGQLGDNTIKNSMVPVNVAGLSGVTITAIAAGLDHSLALDSNGKVWAWGFNASGQLGDGTTTDSHLPVKVTFPADTVIDRILAIGNHSMAFSGTSVWAWGDNSSGQLGVGSTTNLRTPTKVTGFP